MESIRQSQGRRPDIWYAARNRGSDSALFRGARMLLGWSRTRVAQAAGLSVAVVTNIERSGSTPRPQDVDALRRMFRRNGVLLFTGESTGVCLMDLKAEQMERVEKKGRGGGPSSRKL